MERRWRVHTVALVEEETQRLRDHYDRREKAFVLCCLILSGYLIHHLDKLQSQVRRLEYQALSRH